MGHFKAVHHRAVTLREHYLLSIVQAQKLMALDSGKAKQVTTKKKLVDALENAVRISRGSIQDTAACQIVRLGADKVTCCVSVFLMSGDERGLFTSEKLVDALENVCRVLHMVRMLWDSIQDTTTFLITHPRTIKAARRVFVFLASGDKEGFLMPASKFTCLAHSKAALDAFIASRGELCYDKHQGGADVVL